MRVGPALLVLPHVMGSCGGLLPHPHPTPESQVAPDTQLLLPPDSHTLTLDLPSCCVTRNVTQSPSGVHVTSWGSTRKSRGCCHISVTPEKGASRVMVPNPLGTVPLALGLCPHVHWVTPRLWPGRVLGSEDLQPLD